ncbi:MAG: exodeoxyribonuclease VII large subunit [Clostridia bacterium]|nr:exodeoxyribonuclease VII large subunit [Clostridia bacterium]
MRENNALSVTQLNNYVKTLIDSDDFLSGVAIRGEISNFKRHTSGHLYFTLKDERSEIAAVMFRGMADRLTFAPKSGMKVTVYGRVGVYEATGKYQIYVNAMVNDGAGALYEQYMRLLEKLKAEGLFDTARKKPLPRFPKKIGIVTSPTGAAIRDMINVTGRRFPSAELLICPALVQGAEAPADLVRALTLIDAVGECDVIIIGRGGGSAEDLWAFNDEALVRAVAAARTPIISAVGHETDTTLCDYAADMRAPTPSAAAEQAVPDRMALMQSIDEKGDRLDRAVERIFGSYRARIDANARHLSSLSPDAKLSAMKQKIANCHGMIESRMNSLFEKKRLAFSGAVARLEDVNPLAVIRRGYGMAMDGDGKVVTTVDKIEVGDKLSVLVGDGVINTRVESKKYADESKN